MANAAWWPQGVFAASREEAVEKLIDYLQRDRDGTLPDNETFFIDCECEGIEDCACPDE